MELTLVSGNLTAATTTKALTSCGDSKLSGGWKRLRVSDGGRESKRGVQVLPYVLKASTERGSGEVMKERERTHGSFSGSSAMEAATYDRSFGSDVTEFPVWEKIDAVVRLSFGIGIYGAMGLAGNFICSITGIDSMGGFNPCLDAILQGLGYAAPPIMALLFILDDEVVKLSPHARAIRDVEDEELRSFFYGMSPWQFILIVAASSVGEELFYRAAVQGALADVFLRGTNLLSDAKGMAALTGVLPPFVPFAQGFAAVITAALTGSLYYMASSPKDPTYVVAPVLQSRSGREDLKKLFAGFLSSLNIHFQLARNVSSCFDEVSELINKKQEEGET
ncbi:hypothetical protein K2173_002817 [Erythroxylum novogranatense]|uniref:Uncharacterized protein n=1 Tax=Erythroxylum novogranatense TaxID=1862640 RepID=A0AAV8SQS1_9ROSI|nr:hypothetical protein K2173_002817 [Erythroxylum novogranatense]